MKKPVLPTNIKTTAPNMMQQAIISQLSGNKVCCNICGDSEKLNSVPPYIMCDFCLNYQISQASE